MCGIAGIVAPDSIRYKENLQAMLDTLRHRGPDGEGIAVFDNCILGHRRLSIVDIAGGSQPLYSHDNKKALTFNGEIYGYQAMRAKLDYPFRSQSDTEVILALYEKYGDNFVQHLPGMFAFAIWDDDKHQLICARDRFGEKPLYMAYGPEQELIFASEIKAVLASGLVKPLIDKKQLAYYLQYLSTGSGASIYSNIMNVKPGHVLLHQANGNKPPSLNSSPYWKLPEPLRKIKMDEAEEEFDRLFSIAVEKQLVADVDIGCFLSGGVDSSAVVQQAVQFKPGLQTFSFGFSEGADERAFAALLASGLHTTHRELTDSAENIAALLWKMADVYDEPFADSSNIPGWLLAGQARNYVKVALTGDGSDELLGGYAWYRELLNSPYRPGSFKGAALEAMRKLGLLYKKHYDAAWYRSAGYYTLRHSQQKMFFNNEMLAAIGFREEDIPFSGFVPTDHKAAKYYHNIEDALRADINSYLPADILVKTDRAAMAHGLELRSPFLDVDLASFILSLPPQFKVTGEEDKILLRKAFRNKLPPDILKRKKQGFGAPVNKWQEQPDVQALKNEVLYDRNNGMYRFLDYEKTLPLAKQNNYYGWILLVLSIWFRKNQAHIQMP
jgi:asparagine synthase (glutamine-hydrolysing)